VLHHFLRGSGRIVSGSRPDWNFGRGIRFRVRHDKSETRDVSGFRHFAFRRRRGGNPQAAQRV